MHDCVTSCIGHFLKYYSLGYTNSQVLTHFTKQRKKPHSYDNQHHQKKKNPLKTEKLSNSKENLQSSKFYLKAQILSLDTNTANRFP